MVQSKNVRVATEDYVDSQPSGGTLPSSGGFSGIVNPPVGMYLTIPGVTSYGVEELINGRVRFVPIWSSRNIVVDAFRMRIVSSIQGATSTYKVALFKSTSDGIPDCASGALGQATVDLSNTTGNSGADMAASSDMTLQPGLYWIGDYFKINGSPSATPTMMSYKEIDIAMPTSSDMDINLKGKSYAIDNQNDFPTNNSYVLTLNTNNSNPYIILRRKA